MAVHTMYADKPMQGHGLMQAIARVKPTTTTKFTALEACPLNKAEESEFTRLLVAKSKDQPTAAKKQWIQALSTLKAKSPRSALTILRGMR